MPAAIENILEFLNEIFVENKKHIRGEYIVENINLDEVTFKKTIQLLEDKKFVHLIPVTGSLPMIKITSNGRQFLRGEQPDKNSISFNAKTIQYFGGDNYGHASQNYNNTNINIQGFEKVKSIIDEKDISESLKTELINKINELKVEFQNGTPSEPKISKILESIGTTASWLIPIITQFVGI